MKKNKHIYKFRNQVIVVEHTNKFTRYTGLKRLLINKNNE